MATPTPARSAADAARLYARDGLFWMRDVLTAAEIEELRAAAGANFAEVLRALLVQHAMAESAVAIRRRRGTPRFRNATARATTAATASAATARSQISCPIRAWPGSRRAATFVPSARRGVLGADAECVALGQIVGIGYGWDALDDDDDEQRWHTDGRGCADTDALTLFIPLVDTTAVNGATQFWLGSQESSEAPDESQPTTTLELPAGSAVAFSYRLWHRGPSQPDGDDRPVLYAIIGRPILRGDGLQGLPSLDTGSASLFSQGPVEPPPASLFRLGRRSKRGRDG